MRLRIRRKGSVKKFKKIPKNSGESSGAQVLELPVAFNHYAQDESRSVTAIATSLLLGGLYKVSLDMDLTKTLKS